jgi:NADPH2 dehydrogenase
MVYTMMLNPKFLDMKMPDPRPTFAYLATAVRDKHPRMAYLHVIEPRVSGTADQVEEAGEDNEFLREIWNGGEGGKERTFISAGGHTRETALSAAEQQGGLIAFGRLYIANVSVAPLFRAQYHYAYTTST